MLTTMKTRKSTGLRVHTDNQETIERLTRELSDLRKLPILRRCYDCAHAETDPHADVCIHPDSHGRIEHSAEHEPPPNCPLRSAT